MVKLPDVTLLYVIVAFAICYAVLRKHLFSPLSKILDEREHEAREAERLYAASREELQGAVGQAEQKLSLARREGLKTREDLRAEGLAHLEQELERARQSSAKRLEEATHTIEEQSKSVGANLAERAVALARTLAEKILGRKIAA
jgi:F0F1-type ATP synthase membrane subunit b/b'